MGVFGKRKYNQAEFSIKTSFVRNLQIKTNERSNIIADKEYHQHIKFIQLYFFVLKQHKRHEVNKSNN